MDNRLMKSRLAKILDSVVIGAAVFALSFLIVRYYVRNLYAVLAVAVTAAAAIVGLIRLKGKKSAEIEKNKYFAANTAEHFLYRDESYALAYFFDALKTRYEVVKKKKYLKINSTLIALNLSEPLSVKQTVKYYADAKREKAKTLVILAASAEKNLSGAAARLTDLRLEIFLSDRVYRLLKSLGRVPEFDKRRGALKRRELLVSAFSPKRFKGYMLTFFTLLIGAVFSIWSLYFIITAAVALTMAVLCKTGVGERIGGKIKSKK